jgi:hypothetical protein
LLATSLYGSETTAQPTLYAPAHYDQGRRRMNGGTFTVSGI